MHANDNQASQAVASLHADAAALIRHRGAAGSDAVERLADELVEGSIRLIQGPQFTVAVIDELRCIAGALRAEENRRSAAGEATPQPSFHEV
jgi:hypothetical protein